MERGGGRGRKGRERKRPPDGTGMRKELREGEDWWRVDPSTASASARCTLLVGCGYTLARQTTSSFPRMAHPQSRQCSLHCIVNRRLCRDKSSNRLCILRALLTSNGKRTSR